jgi:hypothetical protein
MTLQILSYNILAGGEDRLPLLLRVIKKQQPDVIALLEARNRAHTAMLAHQLGMDLTIGEANNGKDHVVWYCQLICRNGITVKLERGNRLRNSKGLGIARS